MPVSIGRTSHIHLPLVFLPVYYLNFMAESFNIIYIVLLEWYHAFDILGLCFVFPLVLGHMIVA